MEFHPPKLKRYALDELDSNCQYPSSLKNITLCAGNTVVGRYNGSNVVVDDPNFVHTIYSLGCFGKGSLSRGEPTYLKRKALNEDISDSNVEASEPTPKDNDAPLSPSDSGNRNEESEDKGKDTNDEEMNQEPLTDSTSESCKNKLFASKFELQETLHLNLEEAYFLSYCLGCLRIVDLFDKELSLLDAWRLFCESQEDFVQKYVAYHYYRSKGWVVKPGLKFGGDFVLYKFGPHVTHASYIVLIEVIKENGNISEEHQQSITWGRFIGLNRMAESAGKEVILCRVVWPNDILFNDVQSPEDLKKFNIIEVLTRRWVSSQEREED